jgi:hypothetical protein
MAQNFGRALFTRQSGIFPWRGLFVHFQRIRHVSKSIIDNIAPQAPETQQPEPLGDGRYDTSWLDTTPRRDLRPRRRV